MLKIYGIFQVVRHVVYAEFPASYMFCSFSTFPRGLVVSFFSLGFSGRFFSMQCSTWDSKGAKECKSYRSRKMLQNASFLAIVAVDP